MDFEFNWSSGYPYSGQEVKFVILRINGGTKPYNVKWLINGTEIGKGTMISYRFPSSGDYQLDVIVTDKNGKKEAKNRHFKVAESDLSFRYSLNPGKPEPGKDLKYSVLDLKGGIPPYKISWVLDGKVVSNDKEGSVKIPETSGGLFTLIVEDSRGLIRTGSGKPIPAETSSSPVDFQFWWTRSNPVPGQTVRFGVRDITGGTAPYSVVWKVNGKEVGKSSKIRYNFPDTGVYKLEVIVTDSKGNSRTADKVFNISNKPQR